MTNHNFSFYENQKGSKSARSIKAILFFEDSDSFFVKRFHSISAPESRLPIYSSSSAETHAF